MGPPGVGKGTQAAQLQAMLGVPHVATGDILREAMRDGTALGERVRVFVESGSLVPDALMGELIEQRLRQSDARQGFVLDGFPRTLVQVRILDELLGRLAAALERVFVLRVPEEELVRRLSGRRICEACGAVYQLGQLPQGSEPRCVRCGGGLVQRADDREAVVRKRLRIYEEQTRPVIEAYRSRGMLVEVDGMGSPQAVLERLKEHLDS